MEDKMMFYWTPPYGIAMNARRCGLQREYRVVQRGISVTDTFLTIPYLQDVSPAFKIDFFFVFDTLVSIRVLSATQCAELAVNDDGR